MSDGFPNDTTKRTDRDDIAETQDEENGRAESCQGDPSKGPVSNDNNERHVYKRFHKRRTGLKTTDDHATWRQVYARCNVGVGMSE